MRGLFNYFTVVMIIRGLNKGKKLSGHKKIETLQELGKYIFSRYDLEFEFDSLFRFVPLILPWFSLFHVQFFSLSLWLYGIHDQSNEAQKIVIFSVVHIVI